MPSQTQDSDAEMRDAPTTSQNGPEPTSQVRSAPTKDEGPQDWLMKDETQRIRVLPGDSPTAASFEFLHEDHTLGNALRYVIMKNPDVEFCGYSIPHPSDPKMNLRIQTYDDANVFEVLEKGLNDLMDLCDVVTEKFTIAKDAFPKRPDETLPALSSDQGTTW